MRTVLSIPNGGDRGDGKRGGDAMNRWRRDESPSLRQNDGGSIDPQRWRWFACAERVSPRHYARYPPIVETRFIASIYGARLFSLPQQPPD